MLRHILSLYTVVALFMIATNMAFATPTTVQVNFEPGGYVNMPVPSLTYSPLTISFKSTNPDPAKQYPYLGGWDGGTPGEGWLCNTLGLQDVTYPPNTYPQGLNFFLTWVGCDPINYEMFVDFSLNVDKVEFDIFDIDDDEQFIITACDASGSTVPGPNAVMTVTAGFPTGGGDCGVQHCIVEGQGIRRVKFHGSKSTNNLGFGIDNLIVTYNSPVHTNDWLNKTLKNTSPTSASDFAVILKGNVLPLFWHQDGFAWPSPQAGVGFNSFSATLSGGNTLLHWSSFVDGGNNLIDYGESIHIGWGVFYPLKANVVNAYWTDANGNPVQGSYIKQVDAFGVTNGIYWGWAVWHNEFAPFGIADTAVTLRDVRFAVFDTLVPPDSLNPSNVALENAFQSMSGDTAIRLPYGQSVSLPFPTPIPKDQWVVLKYTIEGPGSAAEVTDLVELAPQASQTEAIPTLTEWGLIIFAVLLVGFMTWVVVRRRRRITIGI